nr:hypothetical protein [Tanacetum cinerariifolium]
MIEEINKDENVNLVKSSEQMEAHETAEHRMDLSTAIQTDDDETLAETLLNIKRSARKKERVIEERSRLLVELIDKRKKMMACKRAKENRNKPPTQVEEEIAQQEDVVAKQDEKESFKKAGGKLKRKTSKAREDNEKRQKKKDDLKKLTLMKYVEVNSDFEEGYMKIMFEPDGDDEVQKNHHSYEFIEWKLYDSCGVHSLMMGE